MASRVFWGLFGLIFLPAAVTSQADQSPPVETISIKSKKVVVDPADIVLGGTTVSAGGPAVTIGGDVVFEDRHEDLFANGVEVLTGSPDIARTKFRSSSKLGSQSKSYHIDVFVICRAKMETEDSSISATTGSSHATATSPSSSLFHPTSSSISTLKCALFNIC